MMHHTDQFTLPRKWRTPRPTFVVSLAAVLLVLAVATGYFEVTQSRKEIMNLLEKEAVSLIEALSLSGENAARAYGELEALLEKDLLSTARALHYAAEAGALSRERLESIVSGNEVVRAVAVNRQGVPGGPMFPADAEQTFDPASVAELIGPLFQEGLEHTAGFVRDWTGAAHYAVAVTRNTQDRGRVQAGAWVVYSDPGFLLEFRRRVGIGRLIQDIGENSEIVYIALQDSLGIISASRNVPALSRLANDPFLTKALAAREPKSRLVQFEGRQMFEVVKTFTVDGATFGLFRIGLKMDAVERALARTRRRALIVGLGLLVVGVILFNFLVTDQNYRLLNKAYAQIKTYTGNILENMADAVVAVDRHGRITLFNRAAERLFSCEAEEAVGKRCGDILGRQRSLLDQALDTGRTVRDEEVSYRLNGRTAALSVTTTLLRSEDGGIHSAVAVLKDLTENKALEANLRQRERLSAMGELAAGVAHEIRNPLNAIGMIAQRFEKEFTPTADEAEYRQLARSVVAETRRANDIIQRFLEFARPPELHLEDTNLSAVAASATALVESQAREQGIAVRTDLTEGLVLPLDRNQMQQVFLNLLQNSLHATPAGGEIVVRTYRHSPDGDPDGGAAVAEVSDTGRGIPQENLGKIFDLYFTSKENGTGMGLSLSHRIVSEHGGRIEVDSEVGKGATMRIILLGPLRNSGNSLCPP